MSSIRTSCMGEEYEARISASMLPLGEMRLTQFEFQISSTMEEPFTCALWHPAFRAPITIPVRWQFYPLDDITVKLVIDRGVRRDAVEWMYDSAVRALSVHIPPSYIERYPAG